MLTRFIAALISALLIVDALPTPGESAPAPGRYLGNCHDRFEIPAALGIIDGNPISFASAHVLETIVQDKNGIGAGFSTRCHTIANVIGGTVYMNSLALIVEPKQLDFITPLRDGGSVVSRTIVPPLAAADRIEAAASSPTGEIEVVISTSGDPSMPRFLTYDKTSTGDLPPIRAFTSSDVKAAVSAVAFDAQSNIYAYDDSGEIVEFAGDAAAATPTAAADTDPTPIRTIAGFRTLLRPAIGAPHGRRPLTIDPDGNIIAADDGLVFTFAKDAAGNVAPLDTIGDGLDFNMIFGLGVGAKGHLYVLASGDVTNPGFDIRVWTFRSLAGRLKGGRGIDLSLDSNLIYPAMKSADAHE